MTQARSKQAKPTPNSVALLIATKKGAFILKSDSKRRAWQLTGPIFLGHIVHHLMLDPRDQRTLLLAAKTGHLGPTVFRSTNFGKTWKEGDFEQLLGGVTSRVFDVYPDSAVIYPGHGDDTTLGTERPHLGEWRARGW